MPEASHDMPIKVTTRDGSSHKFTPPTGETAESWLTNVRRSGQKYEPIGNVAVLVADIDGAVDEKPRSGQTNMEGS
jgi:tellurite resistance protein